MKRTILVLLACLVFLAPATTRAADDVVYFYNWTEYLPAQVLEQFTQETGIRVEYSEYESNEAMYAKVKILEEKGGYDLIVPSSYFVDRMRREGLLMPLDKKLLPNLDNLSEATMDQPFDPGNAFSVPYLWGGTGVAWNEKRVEGKAPDSWEALWDPAYKGWVLLQDDLREVFGIALMRLGYSVNDTDPDHVREAFELLQGLAPGVRVYNSDNPKIPFMGGEVSIGMLWNGEYFAITQEMGGFGFAWPREGGIMWMDCLTIPKGASNVEAAHKLIDFLLRPDIAKAITEEIGYATPNKKAMELLPPEVRSDPVVYPPDAVMERSEFLRDIGDSIQIYEEYWNRLKTGG